MIDYVNSEFELIEYERTVVSVANMSARTPGLVDFDLEYRDEEEVLTATINIVRDPIIMVLTRYSVDGADFMRVEFKTKEGTVQFLPSYIETKVAIVSMFVAARLKNLFASVLKV